jgi:hypothetical protein
VDRDLGTFVQQLRLPDAWQAVVLAEIGADDDAAAQVAQRRARLHADLERAQQYLLSGYITEEQFRAKRAEIQADLAALQPLAAEVDLDEAAARLKDLGRTWADATDEERREIARAFFEAVYCDLDCKQVVAVNAAHHGAQRVGGDTLGQALQPRSVEASVHKRPCHVL